MEQREHHHGEGRRETDKCDVICPLNERGNCEHHLDVEAKLMIGKWAAGGIGAGILLVLGSLGGLYLYMGAHFQLVGDKLIENKGAIIEVKTKQDRVLSDLALQIGNVNDLNGRVQVLESRSRR